MKKIFIPLIFLSIIGVFYIYQEEIINFIVSNHIFNREITEYQANKYAKDNQFNYVKETNNFRPNNKLELYDALYTILNAGADNFIFYCGDEYERCIDDVKELTNGDEALSNINNFVHPYNSYSKLFLSVNTMGKIEVNVQKVYSSDEIMEIDEQVNSIMDKELKENMTLEEKIKAIHDYIASIASYDVERSEAIKNNVDNDYGNISHKANGILQNGKAICGGYTDLMAIFLNKLNVPNYKISNAEHVWNLVYLNGKWLHIDLTWDDPVIHNNGELSSDSLILHEFFLIDTAKLESIEKEQHSFNKNIFSEAK